MARSYNVSFNITGTESGLLAALKSAQNALRGLGNSARAASAAAKASQAGLQGLGNSLKNIQSAAQNFRDLKKALQETKTALATAQGDANSLAAQFNKDKAAAESLRRALETLRRKRSQGDDLQRQNRAELKFLRQQREELKAQAKALGATKGRKIPSELLGTEQGKKLSQVLSQLTSNKSAIEQARQKFQETQSAIQLLSRRIIDTQKQLREADKTARESGSKFNDAKNGAGRLKETLAQQRAALQQLRTQLGAAGFNVSNFASSESRLQSEINRVNAALERQQNLLNAQRQSSQASQEMFNAYNNFQSAIQTAETIATPFKSAVENAMTFEHAMSRVKALTQSQNIREGNMAQVESDMQKLTQQARDLGATTMFTSTQAAQAMGYLGMAGWKTAQIYGTMPGMLNLAAAAGADLAQTADIVSDNMTAMGVPVEQAGHFMDVYAYALTNSNARLTDFGETMKYAAPVAKAYGSTLDETAAMVMMMANAGIKGSMAGTSLRMGLLRLAGPPKTATKEMAKLGLSLSDAQAGAEEAAAVIQSLGIDLSGATTSGEKMTRVLMQLHEKTKDLSQDEKLAAFKGIFGVNAETGWLALFDQGPEVFMKYVQGLRTADGYSKQVAATMLDDTRGALVMLQSAWDAFSERIGEALLPTVRSAIEAFTPLVSAAAQWAEEHPAVVQACAAIAGALAGLIVAAAAVSLAFAGWTFITSQVALVGESLAALGSGALLGGLIGRLAALRTALFGLGGAATLGGWSAMFSAISTKAAAAATAIRGFFASLTLGGMASGVVTTLKSIGTALAGAAKAAFSFAFSPVGVALMALALAGLYCYQNWDRVAPVLSNIAGIISGALGSALQTLQPAIENLMAAFDALGSSGALQQLGMLVTGALATVATAIAGILATIINVGATILSTLTNVITGLVNLISNVLGGNWTGAFENMKSIATAAFEGIGEVAKGILDGILSTVEAIGKAWDFLTGDAKVPTADVPTAPVEAQAAQVAAVDTSAAQAALDAVGDSASNAAANMDGVNTAAQNVFTAGEALAQIPSTVQPAADGLSQIGATLPQVSAEATNLSTAMTADGTATQSHTASIETNSAALQSNIGALDAFGAACQGAVAGVGALGSAASGAAGAVGGLGAAAQSACAQLAAAGANAVASVNAAAANISVKSNAQGGIYKRGAFLTTFAERAPEAAIPLDNSRRAEELWTQAGQILGLLPQTQSIQFLPSMTTPPYVPEERSRGEQLSGRRQAPRRRREQAQIPQMPKIFTQTQPVYGGYGGDLPSRIFTPQTPAQDTGGLFGRLADKIFGMRQPADLSPPTINLTINVTVQGDASEETVRRGVESALPAVEDWSRQYSEHMHERRRRSYA